MSPRLFSLVLAATAVAPAARAGDEPSAPKPMTLTGGDNPSDGATAPKADTWNAWVWARARASTVSDFALDRTGFANPLGTALTTRLRLGGVYAVLDDVTVTSELDVLSGQAAGDTSDLGTQHGRIDYAQREGARLDPLAIDLRQAYVSWRTGFGELRAGRMSFRWGLGMVANDGRGEPDFGDKRRGDLVDRVLFATKPFTLVSSDSWAQTTMFLAFDSVARDENADRSRGDDAYQAVGGARWEGDGANLGAIVALRGQTDRVEAGERGRRATLDVVLSDVTGKVTLWRGDSGERLVLEGEGAMVHGRTTRTLFEATYASGADVRTAGGVLRSTMEIPSWDLMMRAEVGAASGDRDPYDSTVRGFSFDPDYRVGLLLFDPVVRRVIARSLERATDPEVVLVPQAGARFFEPGGAITNASYGNLVVRSRPGAGFDLRAGVLVAGANAGLLDAYETASNGAYGTDPMGRVAGRKLLGTEVDGAIRYTLPLEGVTARVLLDAGVLFRGKALDVLAKDTITMARLGVDVAW
jgi:hypothetical protein